MTDTEKIAALRKALEDAVSELGIWLTDNTEEVFEEQPEIDDIRCDIQEALDATA